MQQGLTKADLARLEKLITHYRRQSIVAKVTGLSEFQVSRYRDGKQPRADQVLEVQRTLYLAVNDIKRARKKP